MKRFLLLSSVLIAFVLLAAPDKFRRSVQPHFQPIRTTNFVIELGESQTIPGPVSIANLTATLIGDDTNGIVVEWSSFDSPGPVTFSDKYGLTNQATFQASGRYTIVARAAKGDYYNADSIYVFDVDQGITNFDPQVTITSPVNGATFTSPIDLILVASAEDKDGSITNLVWYDGSVEIWTNTVPPFEFTVTNVAVGNHVFAAGVWDNKGAVGLSKSVSVIINPSTNTPSPPIVQITIPTNDVVFIAPVTFMFTANAVDLDGVLRTVTFHDNGSTVGVLTPADIEVGEGEDPIPYAVSLTPSVGSHQLTVIAEDNDGFQSSSSLSFTVISTPNSNPTVALTAPANGATFTAPATFTLTANASDSDGTITSVRFFRDGTLLEVDLAAPYSSTVTNLGIGTYALYAQAVDNSSGISTSATNTITVNPPPGIPPVVSLTSPTEGQVFTVGTPITLSANATDDGTIANVGWYDHGTNFITSDQFSPYTQTWTPAANAYLLTAVAWDNLGLMKTSSPPVSITVNPPIPPFVQLTLPTNNSVLIAGSNVPMAATATDSDGTITKVDFMQFQPDVFIMSDLTSPYTGTWTNVPVGSYSLVAKAYDSSGLTTISPAIHVTITTAPANIVVDAGPFPTATLSPYKNYFDSEYITQSNSFNTMAASGNGTQYLNMQVVMDATVNTFDGTKETNYLNRALIWSETMLSKATLIDNGGKKNWLGSFASPYSPTNMASQVEEFSAGAAMSRVARVIYSDPSLQSVYGTRALAIYNFLRDEIVNKNLVTRGLYPEYVNFSRTTTSGISDKPFILMRLLLDLKTISVVLGNNDNASFGWPQKITELAEGIKDYNGLESRFVPWQFPGALVWSHGKAWQTYTDFDTGTGNRLPFSVIQGYEMGQTFTTTHINGLADLLTKVMWDQSVSAPLVSNFINGDNGPYNGKAANVNGTTYDGWLMLGGYNTNALNFAKYLGTAVKNGVPNATLTAHNTAVGRTAIAGALTRDVTMTGTPPYATLLGSVSGSGTTGTNWTHVSGPSGFTIVSPGTPQTRVLFTPSAVGSHTFRLTVTSAGPTVSDDVVVTVLAAPAFGSGTPPQPQPAGTNIFSRRYIFYRGNMTSSTDKDRLIAVLKRGSIAGYNGVVLQDSGCIGVSNAPAGCLANLNAVKSVCASSNMVLIPYAFVQFETTSGNPVDIREAVPVSNTKFVRSGAAALAVGDPAPVLVNGGFESFSGNQPTGWSTDLPGTITFIDSTNKHSGAVSLRITNPKNNPNIGHARAYQFINVVSNRAYKVSAWVKTAGFSPTTIIKFYCVGNPSGRVLWSNRDGGLGTPTFASGTQDWTQHTMDINTVENTQIILYCMASGTSGTGTVWFDDVTLTEVGLYSTVRRATVPVTVKSYDLATTYTETSDYVVGAEQLTIPFGSTIPPGSSLKVSWGQNGNMMENQVNGNAYSPNFWNILTNKANAINSNLSAMPSFHIRWNEWRMGNWDVAAAGNITMGQYLSNVMVRAYSLVRGIQPTCEVLFWDDMFNPYHNATTLYTMTRGPLTHGWLGLNTNMVCMNWDSDSILTSLKFFAGLDPNYPKPNHRQILCSFESVATMNNWLNALATAEQQGVTRVIGMMYTTWVTGSDGGVGNYAPLEGVAQACKDKGRWGVGPVPF